MADKTYRRTADDILKTCPPEKRDRYRARAEKLAANPSNGSIGRDLMCHSCVAWEGAEVKRCTLTHCPLWDPRRHTTPND